MRRLRHLSLYSGAGGLDLGFEAAGFDPVACFEFDRDARATLKANRPDWHLAENGDVSAIKPRSLLGELAIRPGELDLVLGGPPCQPFSKSAYWVTGETSRLQDPRARSLRTLLPILAATLPKALVLENVRGATYRSKDDALESLKRGLERINKRHGASYELTTLHLSAVDYGVPQHRERTFLIALRDGGKIEPPTPSRGSINHATSWDAIGGFQPDPKALDELRLRGKWAELIPSIPEGRNYLHHTARGDGLPIFGWRTRFWSFLLKLAPNQPAWTIQANPGPATGPFHWDNRLLSINEMARLQAFPVDYEVVGDFRSARRQVGNAVPVSLAEAIARRVRSAITDEPYDPALNTEVGVRAGCPPPRPTEPVPAKYLPLVGTHPDHPGTGLGPAALNRVRTSRVGDQGAYDAPVDLRPEEFEPA